jgi:hypothetical protein
MPLYSEDQQFLALTIMDITTDNPTVILVRSLEHEKII